MHKRIRMLLVVVLMVMAWQSDAAFSKENPVIHLEPNMIPVNAFYNGSAASLSGMIPEDAEVLIRVSKEPEDTSFFKKGRVWRLFWMNTGEITFKNVPGVYMLYLPGSIPESAISDRPAIDNLHVGFDSLMAEASVSPGEENKELQMNEFIKLKKTKGLYAVHENAVIYQEAAAAAGMKTFSCELEIPSAMRQGVYQVETFIISDKEAYPADVQTLKIERTGLPAMIVSLAFGHSLFYGIFSALIALAAGLLMGFIFKGEKGAH